MQTTSTQALAALNASGSLAVTASGVPALPVFAGPVNAAQRGAYITPSPDFQGNWSLYRRTAGYQADAAGIPQLVLMGDNTFINFASTAPLANLSSMDSLSLVVTSRTSGSITMSVTQ